MTRYRTPALQAALLLGGPLTVFAVVVGQLPVPVAAAIAVAVGSLLAAVAYRFPAAAVAVAVAVVVLVPYYDGRLVTRAIGVTPMTAACVVLLPAAWAARGTARLMPLDLAMGSLLLLRCLGLIVNFSNGLGAIVTVLAQVGLPYLVFRLLLAGRDLLVPLALVVVTSAVALSFVGISERGGTPNPFFTWVRPEYQAAKWARAETRDHGVRAEASFGHPIAFGMFLVVALVLAVGLALTLQQVWLTALLLAGSGVITLALADTLSRGPLLAAGLGVALWLLLTLTRVSVLRLGLVSGLVTFMVVGTPVLGIVQRLAADTTAVDSRVGASTQYRLEILSIALDPDQFSLLGTQNEEGGVTQAVYERTGLVSIDSEFALTFLVAGALSLLALLVVTAIVLRLPFAAGLSPFERAWAVAMAATTLNLLTVALLTQQAELHWAWLGLLAGVMQRRRSTREPRAVRALPERLQVSR